MSPRTREELPQGVNFAQEESDATRTEVRGIFVFWDTIGHVKVGALGAERRGRRNWALHHNYEYGKKCSWSVKRYFCSAFEIELKIAS